jgi:glycosyltransferase involved in cell wall biosynthesis
MNNVSAPPQLRSEPAWSATNILICFSHLRWNFVHQRPQHLLSRAAQHYSVLFFEEPLIEGTGVPELRSMVSPEGVRVLTPLLPARTGMRSAVNLQRRMVDALLAGVDPANLFAWYYTPMALRFTAHLQPSVCIYDNMDELSAFHNAPPQLIALESELFARAGVVFTGGQSLYEAKRHRHSNIHAFPSSIDLSHFAKARGTGVREPVDQAGIARPRIGFFGVIDERMDLGLLAAIAALRPAWQLTMIGPVAKIDHRALPHAPNIHWLGPKSYSELPAYLSGWDAGIMPFALNESTRFISPTKTPEFLAAGVPVVSTPIADVIRPYGEKGLVEIAAGPDEFVAAIERSLGAADAAWRANVDQHLAANSWDLTWARMQTLIEAARTGRQVRPRQATHGGEARV